MTRALVVCVFLTLVAAPSSLASEDRPTSLEVQEELFCADCNTTLAEANVRYSGEAIAFILDRIAAGDTKSEIEHKLVAEFGRGVLASPPKEGFDLLAWVLPLLAVGAGAAVLAGFVVRWSRRREPEPAVDEQSSNGRAELDPALEKRLEDELARFE
jgi:cytochrome c-type biogenesis protein CcmH